MDDKAVKLTMWESVGFLIASEIFLCTVVQDAQTKELIFLWPSSIEFILEPNAFVVGKLLKWKITEKIPHTVCKK